VCAGIWSVTSRGWGLVQHTTFGSTGFAFWFKIKKGVDEYERSVLRRVGFGELTEEIFELIQKLNERNTTINQK